MHISIRYINVYKAETINNLTKTDGVYLIKQKSCVFLLKGKIRPQIRMLSNYLKFRPHFTKK